MSYALDVTGTSTANRITDEYAYVSPGRELKEPALVIPRVAPFFGWNLEIYTAPQKRGQLLVQGEDYILLNPFVPFMETEDKNFFYGIWFKNPEVTKSLWLNYNTLGGTFGVDEQGIFEDLLGMMTEQIYYHWDQIEGKPLTYPPRFHTHKESEEPMPTLVAKFKDLIETVGRVTDQPVDLNVPEV